MKTTSNPASDAALAVRLARRPLPRSRACSFRWPRAFRGRRRCADRPARYLSGPFFLRHSARRASSSISVAGKPLAARRNVANAHGCCWMIPGRSEATFPANASNSSGSSPSISAIRRTVSSPGGGNSSRSTFDRYVGLIWARSANFRRLVCCASRRARMWAPNFLCLGSFATAAFPALFSS